MNCPTPTCRTWTNPRGSGLVDRRNSYWRRDCVVLLDDDDGRPLSASTYFAERQPNPPRPNQAYKDLIVAGARRWGLPAHYIAELERIEVDP